MRHTRLSFILCRLEQLAGYVALSSVRLERRLPVPRARWFLFGFVLDFGSSWTSVIYMSDRRGQRSNPNMRSSNTCSLPSKGIFARKRAVTKWAMVVACLEMDLDTVS